MNTSHLAPRANSGGALPARSSVRLKALGIISRFPTGALGNQLRSLILIGSCLLPAQGFASSTTVTLAWDANTQPDTAGYQLRYGESSGNYTSTVEAGSSTTASVSGLTEGKTYYFAVFAYNSAGLKSPPSNEAMHSVGVSIIANDTLKVHYVSSEQPDVNPARYAIDGDPNTFWHSEWKTPVPPPHELQLDLGSAQNLRGFRYLTRQDTVFNGTIAKYEFYVSSDGLNWGSPVASGLFEKTKSIQQVLFAPTNGRYVRLRALSEVEGQPYANVAELILLEETPTGINTAPSAIAQSYTTPENTPVAIVLTGSDREGSPLNYKVVSGPSNGKIEGTPPNLNYTPTADFNGNDSLTFRVNDGSLDSELATISISISISIPSALTPAIKVHYVSSEQPDVNPARYAIDGDPDTFWHSEWKTPVPPPHELQLDLGSIQNLRGFRYLTRQDALFNGTIAQYEFFISSDGINWRNPVASGFLQKTKAVQQVLFTPTSGRYVRLRALSEVDGKPYTNVAELTFLQETPSVTNSAPSAVAQSFTTPEDTPVSILLTGSDPEGSSLTYAIVSGPTQGQIGGTPPNLTYAPAADFNGSDSLTFRVNDGGLDSALATVSITVTAVNDAPIAIAKSYITPQATPIAIVLSGSDKERSILNYTIVSGPANGSLSGVAPDLTYSPAANFSGNDNFTFRVNDGATDSGDATISIAVTPVVQVVTNLPPGFPKTLIEISTSEDKAFRGQLSASDPNPGDTLTFAKVSGPGWLVVSPTGRLSGIPLNEDVGANSFTLSVTDSANATANATLLINVSNTNDAPTFTKTSFTYPSGAEQTPFTGQSLAGTATDPDKNDPLTYSKINGPSWLLISKTGELSGTPPLGSKGLNKFTIRAADNAGASSRSALQIQIDQNSLPLPWTANTIGVASIEAEAEYSAGNYTLAGAGTLTSTEDTGTFGYQTLTADGEIIARVTKLDDTGAAAHVGVTIRESLAPNSRLVSIGVNGAAAPRQLTRIRTGGNTKKTISEASSPLAYAAGPPAQSAAKSAKSQKIWLRLVRKGDTVTSYTSSNGSKWKKVSATTVKLHKNCYIGLSVISGKDQRLNTSTFSNVRVRR